MISPPLNDVVSANVNGFELKTVDDFWHILAGTEAGYEKSGDEAGLISVRQASERFDLLLQAVPRAQYVLWERDGPYIVIAPSVESLRSEYPWLRYTRVVK